MNGSHTSGHIRTMKILLACIAFCCAALITSVARAELTAAQLLLVVNRNVPASATLAEAYAKARGVPDGRIVRLDVPITEQVSWDVYERQIALPIRQYLRQNKLDEKVTCIVTFYGVPLRVADHVLTRQDWNDGGPLLQELHVTTNALVQKVTEIEGLAAEINPSFQPEPAATQLDALNRRTELALVAAVRGFTTSTAPKAVVEKQSARLRDLFSYFFGSALFSDRFGTAELARTDLPVDQRKAWEALARQSIKARADLQAATDQKYDRAARQRVLTLTKDHFGALAYARTVQGVMDYMSSDHSVSAVDSELSLVHLNFYPRANFVPNALNYSWTGPLPGRLLMVSRIDGPNEAIANQLILIPKAVEPKGLQGQVVIDSRGIPESKGGKPDAYGQYDETLRGMRDLMLKTRLRLLFDDQEAILPVGSAQNVAAYCGWYSVGRYVRSCQLTPGAVAFHVASYECTSLHDPTNTGWCPGLLRDGAGATLGAVAEPYLTAFPPADDFYGLLLTGKLTLAEVYWRTVPLASWQMTLIGDPLYRPYAANPALRVADLPPRLAAIVADRP